MCCPLTRSAGGERYLRGLNNLDAKGLAEPFLHDDILCFELSTFIVLVFRLKKGVRVEVVEVLGGGEPSPERFG